MDKSCSKCNEIKSVNQFTKSARNKSGYFSYCKACVRKNNAESVIKYRKKFKERLGLFACASCGLDHPSAKEVHHLHTSYKRYGRSQALQYNLEDIEKGHAVVLCPTCHVLFHAAHGGKNQPFPEYSKEETVSIIKKEMRNLK